MSIDMSFRRADAGDLEHIRWGLYVALAWNPERDLPPAGVTLEHPEASRYHRDWGRRGDIGVIASTEDGVAGVAYCRLFTAEDHGHGYVDDETPEVAVAVREGWRGSGLGTALLNELAAAAREQGFAQLSLSVDVNNPALRLYHRLGYRELTTDERGVRMILDLEDTSTAQWR